MAARRSHFDVHLIRSGEAPNGDQNMAISQTAEHDQPVQTDVEGEICEFARRDIVANPERQPDNEPQLEASNINSVLQQATATSLQEINKLITELQALRDMLHSEAARVQREIVQYSTLTQAALQSTKVIAESLELRRKVPGTRMPSDGGLVRRASEADCHKPAISVCNHR